MSDAQPLNNGTASERRRGIPELARAVECLREKFDDAYIKFEEVKRIQDEDIKWREKDAKPVLRRMIFWQGLYTGLTLLGVLLLGMITYIFHGLEQKVDANWNAAVELTKSNADMISKNTALANQASATFGAVTATLEAHQKRMEAIERQHEKLQDRMMK